MENQIPKPFIIVLALIQGVLLTLLYQSVEQSVWPATQPIWLTSLATFAISFPLLTFLCITKINGKEIAKYLLPFCLLLSTLGGYIGLQLEPIKFVNNDSVLVVFGFTALLASFKALMYIQQYMRNQPITYSSLFSLSWRNFIIFGECWLFVAIFWGILHLGAGLFAVVEIEFFQQLLRKDWFVIPVLNLAFGFAIIVFRNITHTADNISTILQTLIKFLLPALTIVSLGFLATLPFTGLNTLWKTGSGSLLVMWLQALTLFFVNAVYQDESHERPYHPFIHRLIFIGIALLPVYSIIAAYGLWLRVEQYGLTIDRCWALLVWLLLTCFSFGYLIGILKKRDAWLETLSKVNIAMGMVVLVVMLLVNSPVLNFQNLSAKSQLARLDKGLTTYEDFDYQYFGRSLGRQGYLALQNLKKELNNAAPDKVAIIDRMYINTLHRSKENFTLANFKTLVTFWPQESEFSTDLIEAVYNKATEHQWSGFDNNSYYFLATDLNGDQKAEFVIITENNYSTSANLWFHSEGKWQSKYMPSHNPAKVRYLKEQIMENNVTVIKPKWSNLKVGDVTFKAPIN
ncbi:DUF4153 domain-containing protein [Thalassotalea sp. 1_MG-2023]|uniref:DUF4153 domain-containing protein n=1 Tax=Thalassotalea sp. 1_MG-2023 TaxID=3062680 RepID=UPI0026E3A226|nr:DUF4153 domain-containing protein [Thalassotalea sp. 1_MG-2023]MDO6425737.1 DUF4153 domain-containing protein [Thalassotalea sp. 1_MG-2023]